MHSILLSTPYFSRQLLAHPQQAMTTTAHPNHTATLATLSMKLEKPRSSLPDLDLTSDTGISAGRRRPGSVFIRTCVDKIGTVGCFDDGSRPRIVPDCIFETQRLARMTISVAAMPCVIFGALVLQRILGLPWVKNTHVDLYRNPYNYAQRGELADEADDENKLHGKIEHSALDDDIDGSKAYPCREFPIRATHVVHLARREVPNAPSNEGCHYHVCA